MLQNKPKLIEFAGTPEAGKTTSLRTVSKKLANNGFNVAIVRESAEIVPKVFPKGDYSANLWMRLQSVCGILQALYDSTADVVLVDRGIFDAIFWLNMFKEEISLEHYGASMNFFKSLIICKPDLLVCLQCSPETAIKRRGGEGRIVKEDFLYKYNEILSCCYERYSDGLKEFIHTDDLTVEELVEGIFLSILDTM